MASIAKRSDGGWRARYRDGGGREHARHFARKVDAQRWLDEVTTAVVTGQYVDPRAGKITVCQYAESWQGSQTWRPKTAYRVESALRVHVLPAFGDRPLAAVRPRQLDEKSQRVELTTNGSYRRVPLPSVVADRLAAQLAVSGRCEGLVFTDASGLPIKRKTFGKTWRPAVQRAGLGESLRLHDRRHAYASALIAAGESVKVIQAGLE